MTYPHVSVQLPPAGEGFTTYNRELNGADQYGTKSTIERIVEIGRRWRASSAIPFAVGDISRKGGGVMPPHKSHQLGVDFDLRPLRTDGKNLPCEFSAREYSRDLTRRLIGVIREVNPQAKVFFNDPVLIKEGRCAFLSGHHNHLHIRFVG